MMLKFLGVVDVISALFMIFNVYIGIITLALGLILVVKGISSMFYDVPGLIVGVVDVVSALFLFFSFTGLLPLKVVLFIVLMGKGVMSFL